jgi:hypothetical protein
MNEDIVYVPTPIEEKPEKEGWYTIFYNDLKSPSLGLFENYQWKGVAFKAVSWLKPVSKQEFVREIARKSWEACEKRIREERMAEMDLKNGFDDTTVTAPDLETYLSNL